jgi:hypothetical protein
MDAKSMAIYMDAVSMAIYHRNVVGVRMWLVARLWAVDGVRLRRRQHPTSASSASDISDVGVGESRETHEIHEIHPLLHMPLRDWLPCTQRDRSINQETGGTNSVDKACRGAFDYEAALSSPCILCTRVRAFPWLCALLPV